MFHSAATVKFDEALKLSVTINMVGTKRLVELCHKMMSLEVFCFFPFALDTCLCGKGHICIYGNCAATTAGIEHTVLKAINLDNNNVSTKSLFLLV